MRGCINVKIFGQEKNWYYWIISDTQNSKFMIGLNHTNDRKCHFCTTISIRFNRDHLSKMRVLECKFTSGKDVDFHFDIYNFSHNFNIAMQWYRN